MAYFLRRVDAGSSTSETQDCETAKIATTSHKDNFFLQILSRDPEASTR
jgi:hypothetical protein